MKEVAMRLLFACFFACCLFAGRSKSSEQLPSRHLVPHQSLVLPYESPPDSVDARIAKADALLEKVSLDFVPAKKGGSTIAERPCAVACLDEKAGKWYVVHFALPYPMKAYFAALKKAHTLAERAKCVVSVHTLDAGFRVTHKGGAGPTLLTVIVEKEEGGVWHELVPYRLLFSRLSGKDDRSLAHARKNVRFVRTTPVVPQLDTDALAKAGEELVRTQVRFACAALREARVMSKAFPEKQLSELFPHEVVMALMVSEQWDPLCFVEAPSPSVRRVLATYALDREQAFAWSTSPADAIGCLQFTNKKGNGTYAAVVRAYPRAGLVRTFDDGARDMHNVIKAALCLLDLELAQSGEAKKAFLVDPYLGALYAVAAYNDGHGGAEKMLAEIRRINSAPLSRLDRTLLALPGAIAKNVPARVARGRRNAARMNTETPVYAKKYLYLIDRFVR